jgi:hypothetical protein
MAHRIVEITSIKPDNVEWFSDVYPEEYNQYLLWVKTLEGVMFLTASKPDKNTVIRTYIFESEEASVAYAHAHQTNYYATLRREYNAANGISSTRNFIDE